MLDAKKRWQRFCILFDLKTELDKKTGCINWMGCRNLTGYGKTAFNHDGQKIQQAHRFAWYRRHGSLPPELSVLHKCDNRSCVNPEHLFLGTQCDNNKDMKSKKRARGVPGNKHRAKLTPVQVLEIRKSKEKYRVLAARYKISKNMVFLIRKTNKHWNNI